MEEFNEIVRGIHISAGAISLLSGLVALGLVLKPSFHRRAGKVFFYGMIFVFITAVYLSIVKDIQFLFAVAILSFFSAFHGVRALLFWRGMKSNWADWLSVVLLLLSGVFLSARGLYLALNGYGFEVALHLVFGMFMLILGFTTSRNLVQIKPNDIGWFKAHRGNMIGALIATITAFSTTSLTFLPPIVAWFGPAFILSPILSLVIKRTDKRFNIH